MADRCSGKWWWLYRFHKYCYFVGLKFAVDLQCKSLSSVVVDIGSFLVFFDLIFKFEYEVLLDLGIL